MWITSSWGFQPDKLEPSFGARQDGVCARFCFSWPSEAEYWPLENSADAVDPLIYDILTWIIDLPAENDGVFTPHKIGLSATAMEEFEQYRKFVFKTTGAGMVLQNANTCSPLGWNPDIHPLRGVWRPRSDRG
jgi:hypothetical protein